MKERPDMFTPPPNTRQVGFATGPGGQKLYPAFWPVNNPSEKGRKGALALAAKRAGKLS